MSDLLEKIKPVLEPFNILLRGVGQVVFQGNALSGLVILIGIFVASISAGIAAVVGVIVGTLTAILLKVDKGLINAGLLGFNAVLVGAAFDLKLNLAKEAELPLALPSWEYWVLLILASALSSLVFMALGKFLSPWNLAALTMPFILCAWIFIGSVDHPNGIDATRATEALEASAPAAAEASEYSLKTLYIGLGKGFSEIFLQDSAIGGYIILLGILINSRIAALMGFLAALLSIPVAMMFGLSEWSIQMGLHTYNPILTALALSLFLRFDSNAGLYGIFGGAFVTVWVTVALDFALTYHLGFPVYTFPFVVVTWFMLLAAMNVGAFKYILPSEATSPEDNLKRLSATE